MTTAYTFLTGVASGLAIVAALFFLRYWRRTRDRFFLLWSVSFVLMACQWGAAALLTDIHEAHPNVYLLRLAAFLLIIVAIVDKNRGSGGKRARVATKAVLAAVGINTESGKPPG